MDVKAKIEKTSTSSLRSQLAKLVLATAAGFIATKLTEKAYDKYVTDRNVDTSES